MVGILVHGNNHFILSGPLPDEAAALALVRHWSIVQIGEAKSSSFGQWQELHHSWRGLTVDQDYYCPFQVLSKLFRPNLGGIDFGSDRPEDRRDPGASLEKNRSTRCDPRSSGDLFLGRIRTAKDEEQPTRNSDQLGPSSRARRSTRRYESGGSGLSDPEGHSAQRQKPVQPGARPGVRPDRAATDLVALVPSHARDASACKWRISQDRPSFAWAFRSRDDAQRVHPHPFRLAEGCSRASGGSFVLRCSQLRDGGSSAWTVKLMKVE